MCEKYNYGGMNNIKDEMFEYLKKDHIRQEISNFVRPIVNIVYNEIYIYVWFICIYSVLLLVITLANLFVLMKIVYQPVIFSRISREFAES
jgi:hypothetical protein